jgi:hypothetical protein
MYEYTALLVQIDEPELLVLTPGNVGSDDKSPNDGTGDAMIIIYPIVYEVEKRNFFFTFFFPTERDFHTHNSKTATTLADLE